MAHIRSVDMLLLDKVFDMESGYVLDFSDASMRAFYAHDLNIDIDDLQYRVEGTSKAKRTRCFLRKVSDAEAKRVLQALWDYRQAMYLRCGKPDPLPDAESMFLSVIGRLEGKSSSSSNNTVTSAVPAYNWAQLAPLREKLLALASMDPHPRGPAFERFLADMFHHFAMAPRGAFSLRGEQIDGSFQHEAHTYLLEAKWHNVKTQADDLRIFEGKLQEKAAWSRGLFVSHAGFTEGGLEAFGRNKRLLCMDGLDLYEVLERRLPLGEVIARKARKAAETGRVFVPVRELFP